MAREYPTPSDPAVIPDDLIKGILKFVPVKCLMRFKCVSKNWLSIITEPSFTSAYSGGFRGPVAFWPAKTNCEHRHKEIHYLGIDDTGPIPTCEAYHHSTVDYGGQKLGHTAVVHGLICLFEGGGNRSWLYNIATRERVQLPASSAPVPTDDKAQRFVCNCRFGFDPVNKLYKLVKLSFTLGEHAQDPASVYFEILTIGVDSCWRIIDSPIPPSLVYPYLSVDGVMYGLEYISHSNCSLSAFHVAEERFLSVPLPPDIGNPAINWRFLTLQLLWFFPGPGPVLIRYSDVDTIRIDRYSYGGGDSGGVWHGELLPVPHCNLDPKGILPNGKVLIADRSDPNIPPGSSRKLHFANYRGLKPASLSLYDPIKRRLEKLVMIHWNGPNWDGPNTTAALARGDYFYLEENIVSLKCLTSCCNNN